MFINDLLIELIVFTTIYFLIHIVCKIPDLSNKVHNSVQNVPKMFQKCQLSYICLFLYWNENMPHATHFPSAIVHKYAWYLICHDVATVPHKYLSIEHCLTYLYIRNECSSVRWSTGTLFKKVPTQRFIFITWDFVNRLIYFSKFYTHFLANNWKIISISHFSPFPK